MNKANHLPFGIHFLLAAQRKFTHAFIHRNITTPDFKESRLNSA
ncbi:hypothetical protein [uncultured Psychromonas sp.]|nr:hypothetical protein [uncultured Psychromonas sp.]